MELRLNQPEFFRDPYPFYAQIRALEQPCWLPHDMTVSSPGVWLFGRYADAVEIFKRASGISKNVRRMRAESRATPFDLHMLHRDAPDHLRLRRLVSDYFSRSALQALEPRVAQVAGELIGAMRQNGRADLMADFAEPLPLRVIAAMMDIPQEDLAAVRNWSLTLGYGFDSVIAGEQVIGRQQAALQEFIAYVRALIAVRRTRLGDDLLSHLISAHAGERLTEDELVGMAGFLLFAGHETTINLIGNGLWLLLARPERWAALKRAPELVPSAVEEILRFESPEQRTSFRVTTEALEIGGVRVEPGQQIGVIIGSANRDEAEFPDPERFDITRSPNRHLAFGLGAHQCLGMQMARMEACVAIGKALEALPGLSLSDPAPNWRHNSFFRGLATLPAEF